MIVAKELSKYEYGKPDGTEVALNQQANIGTFF
jgi:hypothetical protein